MNTDQIRYFLEAARTEHVGQAATRLRVSASAVSHAIAGLEERFGCELFEKRGKRIALTAKGRFAAERLGQVLGGIDAVAAELGGGDRPLEGYLRVAGSHVVADALLAPALAALSAENAGLTIELLSLRSGDVLRGVLGGEVDYGVCFSPQMHPELVLTPLHRGDLVVVVRHGHPVLRLRKDKRLAALSEFPAALPKAVQGVDVCEQHPVLAQFGLAAKAAFVVDSYAVATKLLEAGDAWGLFPDVVLPWCGDGLTVPAKPAGWSADYTLSAVESRRRPLGRVSALLGGILRERMRAKKNARL